MCKNETDLSSSNSEPVIWTMGVSLVYKLEGTDDDKRVYWGLIRRSGREASNGSKCKVLLGGEGRRPLMLRSKDTVMVNYLFSWLPCTFCSILLWYMATASLLHPRQPALGFLSKSRDFAWPTPERNLHSRVLPPYSGHASDVNKTFFSRSRQRSRLRDMRLQTKIDVHLHFYTTSYMYIVHIMYNCEI